MHVPTLETERLLMRPWRESDLDHVADFYADEATAKFVGGVCARDDAWRRMASMAGHWHLRGYGPWALQERTSGAYVGQCGPWAPEGWPEPELMWSLMKHAHGKGYATEAAQRTRRYAYEVLGWSTLISLIVPENKPSRRVASRLGARIEKQIELRGYRMDVHRHPGPEAISKN